MGSWLVKKSLSCWWEDPPSAAVVVFRTETPGMITELCVCSFGMWPRWQLNPNPATFVDGLFAH